MSSANASCLLDPIPPTWLLKQCCDIDILLPVITQVTRLSLRDGIVPDCRKNAMVRPLLKKQGLDPEFKNYRPVSNLPFIAKIARLRHLIPFSTLLNIYRSLIEPYICYGLVAWGQALNTHLDKIVTLQKRALRLMYFVDYKSHSVPLFVNSGILPVKLLYFKSVASLLHDVDNQHAPPNISNLFTRSKQIHSYSTRSAITRNFHVEMSRTNERLLSFSRISTKI